ncbi:MAG: peptidoglycan bridge formation glycyltransferase FemA/FemB family protein [Patescibacteria group bacterium]
MNAMKSFLQTKEWLEFQRSVGNKCWRYDENGISANIVQSSLPFGKNYLYVSYGPEIDLRAMQGGLKNTLGQFISYLKKIARAEGSIFVKIEPMVDAVAELLYPYGLRKSKRNLQPQRTLVVNLNQDEYGLLGQMHHKTRYNIKVAQNHNIVTKQISDIDVFLKLMSKTTQRDKFSSHPREYYEKLLQLTRPLSTELTIAYHEDVPVAGAIILFYEKTGYYLHGASDYEYRNLMAPYALHWDSMRRLKTNGFEHYDLWGIDAKQWPGVSRFKHGFGGRTVEYPGAFDLPISKFWYFLYNQARKIF